MKNLIIVSLVLFSSNLVFSQNIEKTEIPYYNWNNPTTFKTSKRPSVTGYGFYSDSLSKAHNDSTFYVCNNEYYPIETWADYYRWYINKNKHNFIDYTLYEYYYIIKDDYGMANYIANNISTNDKLHPSVNIIFASPLKANSTYASSKNNKNKKDDKSYRKSNKTNSKTVSQYSITEKKIQHYKHISDSFNKNINIHNRNISQPSSFRINSNNHQKHISYNKGNSSFSKSNSSYSNGGVKSSSGGSFSAGRSSGSGSIKNSASTSVAKIK